MNSGFFCGRKVFFFHTYSSAGAHTWAEKIFVTSSCITRRAYAGIRSPSPPVHFTFILYRSPWWRAVFGNFSSQFPLSDMRLSAYRSSSFQLLKSPIRYISVALGAHSRKTHPPLAVRWSPKYRCPEANSESVFFPLAVSSSIIHTAWS